MTSFNNNNYGSYVREKRPRFEEMDPRNRRRRNQGNNTRLPSIILYSLPSESDPSKNVTVLQTKEKVYTLDYLAEGSMHKVWTVEKEPAIVIKTPLQNKTPRDLYEAAKLTKLWHNHLTQREDISAVKFENDMVKDGFQIVERVSISKDEAKSPELRAAVLGLFLKTFTDPKNFISDLAPDNVIWDKEESKVKIIDPSSRAFTFTDMHEIATDIYRCLELWGLLGDCVKKLPDEAEGNKELLAQFKELLVKEPLG